MSPPAAPSPGPVRASERILAPDLARGSMLLLIALANTPWYIWGRELSGYSVHPTEGSLLDRAVQFVIITAVDARVYPMFAFLFGYGMVQLLRRQTAAGVPERSARALLRRRNLWLLVFGFLHAALLWMGDVLGAYGLAGLVLGALFLRRRDTTLLVWGGVLAALLFLAGILAVLGAVALTLLGGSLGAGDLMAGLNASVTTGNYATSVVERVLFWPSAVVDQGLLSMSVPIAILLGFWAARRQILEEPHLHLPLLRTVAVVGVGLGLLGGVPNALHHLGALPLPAEQGWVFVFTQTATGLACGIGYVALFGLLGHRLAGRARHGLAITAVTAVGRRSLSAYLAQSALCAPLLAAWGLGLGGEFGSAAMAAFALGVWLVTVAGCYALERVGRRGPAEAALRRLAYGRAAGRS
ncbi:DUF418 domain-containing protein [Marinactinospora thermotolerans]|uniref:Uncharacterized membrane protein YeiB n=1 Tax=Marinactinospora thermotolerans DSM 45154 TaxID=1122192 RepID=A0A1T4MFU6_9ACTN|nr:DUF418 domain-containing protein [Marinactinospora thermotolerans]SJZ65899.1 Uncharacterized membrane protein YeiB [Marinactinospora thermotolerans DSM 45154]